MWGWLASLLGGGSAAAGTAAGTAASTAGAAGAAGATGSAAGAGAAGAGTAAAGGGFSSLLGKLGSLSSGGMLTGDAAKQAGFNQLLKGATTLGQSNGVMNLQQPMRVGGNNDLEAGVDPRNPYLRH